MMFSGSSAIHGLNPHLGLLERGSSGASPEALHPAFVVLFSRSFQFAFAHVIGVSLALHLP